jgi:hypothetical protein
MTYIESHSALRDHPKTKRLKRLLKVETPTVIGHLQCFWWWVMEYAPDGDITAFDQDDIADAAMWEGDPNDFVQALLSCGVGGGVGFLERTEDGLLLVHDWEEYGGKLYRRKKANAERMRDVRSVDTRHDARNAPSEHVDTPSQASQSTCETRVKHVQTDKKICAEPEERRGEESIEDKTTTEESVRGVSSSVVASWEKILETPLPRGTPYGDWLVEYFTLYPAEVMALSAIVRKRKTSGTIADSLNYLHGIAQNRAKDRAEGNPPERNGTGPPRKQYPTADEQLAMERKTVPVEQSPYRDLTKRH